MKYSPDRYNDCKSPTKVKLEFEEDDAKAAEYKQTNGTHTRTTHARTTDWEHENDRNLWFTEPAHLAMNGTRRSDDTDMETSAIEDYVKSIDKLDNLRSNINRLRDDLELSSRSIDEKLEESSRCVRGDVSPSRSIRGDVSPSRSIRGDVELSRSLRGDTELSRSYRLAADAIDVDDDVLDTQIWSEGAPRPRLSCSATPYREQINSLRLKSLRLDEKRLLEIRRLQELEKLRGPQPKWYELKTPQFCVEAKKNNEILSAKKQWSSYRDYTESVWKSKDFTRSTSDLL